ncbi:hypothetical protein QWI29_05945 [Mycolicibacterium neoaurum]|uniref:hypothetical protein n=1 Tax=Mycolicibacterium neoaurum TaxID=1795 RepID=UPI002672F176|nr:hypothetical protein [Mycolicibacterium neoaurum]MDO3399568.1 hypothetical protein [Mycolicibacterium neoaurum]
MSTPVKLPDELREVFATLADTLIPAADDMPSAGQAGVPLALIDRVLGYRADLAEDFVAAVAACANREPEAALDDLASSEPEQFATLTLLTIGAYTLSDDVLASLGLVVAPQPVIDDIDTYVDLLTEVVDRGFDRR